MRLSCSLKESTWSIKGLLLGWFFGVLNIYRMSSFRRRRWVCFSKPASNDSRGRLNFKQLPVSFSSSLVWMLVTINLAEGPAGLFANHMNRSFCLRCSKNIQLLQDFSKHISSITSPACFLFSFDSTFVLGIWSQRSLTRCRMRPAIPLEHTTKVLYRFFHSFEAGSGSLNALNWFSGSKSISPSTLSSSDYEDDSAFDFSSLP